MRASLVFTMIATHPMKNAHSREMLARVSAHIPRPYVFVVIGQNSCIPCPPVIKSPMIGCWIKTM